MSPRSRRRWRSTGGLARGRSWRRAAFSSSPRRGRSGGGAPALDAVTILPSLDAFNLPPGFETPFFIDLVAARLLRMSLGAGAKGIVCAAPDLSPPRALHPAPFYAVTPGIRPAGTPAHDQLRVATVAAAVRVRAGLLGL